MCEAWRPDFLLVGGVDPFAYQPLLSSARESVISLHFQTKLFT